MATATAEPPAEAPMEPAEFSLGAAAAIGALMARSLGPRSRVQLLRRPSGRIVATQDGARVLAELAPRLGVTGRLLADLSRQQDAAVGDGTTTVVVLAGALCGALQTELEHRAWRWPDVAQALRCMRDACLERLDALTSDGEQLAAVAAVLGTKTCVAASADAVARICVDAVAWAPGPDVLDRVRVVKTLGGAAARDTRLVRGVLIAKTVALPGMPTALENGPAVALVASEVRLPRLRARHARATVADPAHLADMQRIAAEVRAGWLRTLEELGVQILVCQFGIDQELLVAMQARGLTAIQWVPGPDLERLVRATGAAICPSLGDLDASRVGAIAALEEVVLGHHEPRHAHALFADPRACTIVVGASSEAMANETEEALRDGLRVASGARAGRVVPGGGATDVALYRHCLERADRVPHPQLQRALAAALLRIPQSLAETAGLDPIAAVAEILDAEGRRGIDAMKHCICDARAAGLVEPAAVKRSAVALATDFAAAMVRTHRAHAQQDPPRTY